MATGPIANIFSGASTDLNTKYLMSQFTPTITITNDDGTQSNVIDIFNPNIIKAIKSINRVGYSRYVAQPITTVAYLSYGNTTCWWIVMLANGLLNALLIEAGSLLNMPDIDAVVNSLNASTNNQGARIPTFTSI